MLHLSENSARWSNLIGKLVREYPMYYPSWHKIEEEKKAGVLGRLMIDYWIDPKARCPERTNKCLKPGKEQGLMSAGNPLTGCPSRSAVESLRDREYPLPSYRPSLQYFMVRHKFAPGRARVQIVRGDALAEGSRRQYADGCSLHRGPDTWSWFSTKGTAAGVTFRVVDVDELKEEAKRTRRELEFSGAWISGVTYIVTGLMAAAELLPPGRRRHVVGESRTCRRGY
ncbi:hypothetical protein Tco_1354622 [Tanacetum coccineum]